MKPGTPAHKHAQVQWPLSLYRMLEEMEGTPGCEPPHSPHQLLLPVQPSPTLGFGATGCQGPPFVITTLGRVGSSPQSCWTCGSLLPSSPKHMGKCDPQMCHSRAQGYEPGSCELPMLPPGPCGGALCPHARHKGVPIVGEPIPSSAVRMGQQGDPVTCRAGMH